MKLLSTLINEYFDIKPDQHLALSSDDNEPSFSYRGCDIIRPLGNDVYNANWVIFEFDKETGDAKEIERGDITVSFPVLDALYNGAEYYVDERGNAYTEYDATEEQKATTL